MCIRDSGYSDADGLIDHRMWALRLVRRLARRVPMVFTEDGWRLARGSSGAYVEVGPVVGFLIRDHTILRVCEFDQ
eukprot:8825207-Alexandrium_andersonii.AAC.1